MRIPLMVLVSVVALSAPAAAQKKDEPKANSLLKQAKVTEEAARQAALAKVPNGKITEGELEKEGGKLIWSFDIKVPGKPGVEEVHVDALTGAVIAQEHEDPKAEAGEKAKEKAAPKKKG